MGTTKFWKLGTLTTRPRTFKSKKDLNSGNPWTKNSGIQNRNHKIPGTPEYKTQNLRIPKTQWWYFYSILWSKKDQNFLLFDFLNPTNHSNTYLNDWCWFWLHCSRILREQLGVAKQVERAPFIMVSDVHKIPCPFPSFIFFRGPSLFQWRHRTRLDVKIHHPCSSTKCTAKLPYVEFILRSTQIENNPSWKVLVQNVQQKFRM